MPKDIKEQKMRSSNVPKDGDFQISKGRIGDVANFASHTAKRERWRIDTARRA
jgi:hypothetical protein